MVRESKDLLLNRLLSNDLRLFVDFVITLYLCTLKFHCVFDLCTEKHFTTRKRWKLHSLSFYISLLLLAHCQLKI